MTHQMTAAEKKALRKANEMYNQAFRQVLDRWADVELATTGIDPLINLGVRQSSLRDKDGDPVQFHLKDKTAQLPVLSGQDRHQERYVALLHPLEGYQRSLLDLYLRTSGTRQPHRQGQTVQDAQHRQL